MGYKNIFFTAILFFTATAVFAGSAAVVLKSKDVYIAKEGVCLSDIADLVDVPYEDNEKLADLYIKRAAVPGFKTVVTKEFVVNKLARSYAYLEVRGPQHVNVFTSKASVPRADIESAAKEYVLSKMEWKAGDTEIQVKKTIGNVSVIDGAVTLKVKDEGGLKWKGSVTIPVEIYIDGKYYKVEPVSMVIKVITECAQAAGDIQRHAAIMPEMVSMERTDITYLPDDIITDISKLNNNISKRAIMRGTVLTSDMFESLPAFRRGAVVTVLVRVKAVSVAATGTALSDGREGDSVKVKMNGNNKVLEGKVDASGAVVIEK
jgi:flagella basal body P-ring formation protein FlgA